MNNVFKHTKVISVKKAIVIDEELKKFIFKNSNYRRHVWNQFVEEYRRCNDDGKRFNPSKFKATYFNNIEKPNNIYDTYCTGISEQVAKDVTSAIKIANHKNGSLQFKSFNRYKCSFKVHTKADYRIRNITCIPYLCSRVHILDFNCISFRVSDGNILYIRLKESLFNDVRIDENVYIFENSRQHYLFHEYDIKEISFIHELGKFYVQLSIDVTYVDIAQHTKSKAGIDMGIHNPITVVDTDSRYILRMSESELSRIKYLESRISRLQEILSKKIRGSNNYNKLLRKICVSYYKIRNIRINWRRHVTRQLAITYKHLVVDFFETPIDHEVESAKLIRQFNSYNRRYGMFEVNRLLIHMCDKFNSKYITAGENTTNTCSHCGYRNEPLKLSQRKFVCSKCGYELDRDINAAINCFNED